MDFSLGVIENKYTNGGLGAWELYKRLKRLI
jgi:hypothetical protein